jgi:chloride channel protein, CIC family
MTTRLADFAVDRRLLLTSALALPIGVLSAGAAWCLLRLIGLVTSLVFYQRWSVQLVAPGAQHHPWWLMLGAPITGGLVVGMMARFGSEKIRGHGMPEAIEAILTKGSRIDPKVAVLKPVSAAISIGTGGPFGAEGPIIMTGGAVGSILAQHLHLTADERKILLVSGAAGGMAATFNSPLASILLAVELLLFEWRPRSLIPVSAAVVVATAVRQPILGSAPVFLTHPGAVEIPWHINIFALFIGVCGAVVAIAATRLVYLAEDMFGRLPIHWMWWPAIGGAVIGVGGLIAPRSLGVGYDVIDELLTGRGTLALMIGILVVKTTIWSLSLGSGTSGGVLAPVFMIGAALGALVGQFLPDVFPGFWAILGLAAVVGGVMRSPLTGIVFTLELTHAWPALLPLVVASITAYAASVLLLDRSVLTEKIARRGLHLTRDYTTDPLEMFLVAEVMRPGPPPTDDGGRVDGQATLRHAANLLAASNGRPLRVVGPDGVDDGHLLLQDLLTARRHDLNEATDRARPLLAFAPRRTGDRAENSV